MSTSNNGKNIVSWKNRRDPIVVTKGRNARSKLGFVPPARADEESSGGNAPRFKTMVAPSDHGVGSSDLATQYAN